MDELTAVSATPTMPKAAPQPLELLLTAVSFGGCLVSHAIRAFRAQGYRLGSLSHTGPKANRFRDCPMHNYTVSGFSRERFNDVYDKLMTVWK